jgi:hypothetical protein
MTATATQRWQQGRHKEGGDGIGNGDGDNGNEVNNKDDNTDWQKEGGRERDLRIDGAIN